MKLSSSTGDFYHYASTAADCTRCFKDTKFRYINLEQTGRTPERMNTPDDSWKKLAEEYAEAAAYAGVKYVVSHAPCLNPFADLTEETYEKAVTIIRRSVEICGMLRIPRIVIHAGTHPSFTAPEYYRSNRRFYREFFDLMEKYGITVMTENMQEAAWFTLSTGKEMRELIEYIQHPLVAGCWDTAHGNINTQARNEGQYASILALGDKLKGLHISDNFGGKDHQHTWPFAGIINFDSVMQGLIDVKYDGYFNFEASYTLLHHNNIPHHRQPWVHNGETVTKLLDPSLALKQKAVDLLYETGKYILEAYDCFEE